MSIDEIHQMLKALKTGIKSSQRLEVLKTVREAVDPVWVMHPLKLCATLSSAVLENRPPRSPDITPLDFFLWGYIKDKVYSTPVPNVETLKARVTAALATVTMEMLENTWREIEFRLDVLRATKGAHVEIYE